MTTVSASQLVEGIAGSFRMNSVEAGTLLDEVLIANEIMPVTLDRKGTNDEQGPTRREMEAI